MATTTQELAGEAQLFDAFRSGYEAYQQRDQLAAGVTAQEEAFLAHVRAGDLGNLDKILQPEDLEVGAYPSLAEKGLFVAVSKVRLERADEVLAKENDALREAFFDREVRITPVNAKTTPITRYYFSGGLAGTRRYEPSPISRQKAHGLITDISLRTGRLEVTSKVGTGRITQFFADPYKWGIDMLQDKTGEPLVRVEFVS